MLKLFLSGCRGRKSGGLPAKEALPAINRAALSGFEGNGCLPAALRAGGHGFGLGETTPSIALTLSLAGLAALGFVLEVLAVEEVLFSRCKYKFRSAVHTFEDPVLKLRHNLCPVAFQ
jgi:hypothetical protein